VKWSGFIRSLFLNQQRKVSHMRRMAPLFIMLALILAACAEEPPPVAEPPASPTDFVEIESPETAPAAPERVVVPDVVGVKLPKAQRTLRDVGLDPDVRRKASPESEGTVLRQRPLGGLEVQPGRTVMLVVAKRKPPPPPQDCQGYSPCLPPGPDVDCAGGTGDGPRYVDGPVTVTGSDPYDLDGDGDGVGCET
jgi:hypothetical protein